MHPDHGDRVVRTRLSQIHVGVENLIPADEFGTPVQLIQEQIGLGIPAAVAVDDMHLVGTAVEESRYHGVHVSGQIRPSDGVTLRMAEAERVRIGLTGEPLHVVIDEHPKDAIRIGGRVLERPRFARRRRVTRA